jgi:hypothetical protein
MKGHKITEDMRAENVYTQTKSQERKFKRNILYVKYTGEGEFK